VRRAAGHVIGPQRPGHGGGRVARAGRGEREHVAPRHVADVHEVAALAAVFEDPRGDAVLQAGAEYRGHPGVGRVPGHPRAVHVVVPQRHRGPAGEPGPVGRQVLLRDLAGGVGVARVQGGVLAHGRPGQGQTAPRAARLENAGLEVGSGPGERPDGAVAGAFVGAFPVHHHRRGEHQPGHAPAAHGVQQHRRPRHVHVGVQRQVGERHAQSHHRRQMADRVHAVESVLHGGGVTDVGHAKIRFVRDIRRFSIVYGGAERVQAADLMPGLRQRLHHMGSDESRRSRH
jgi:hypothetical protein